MASTHTISQREATFMECALQEAEKSPCLFRHGAVAVVNGRILARGHNTYRTHSRDKFIRNCCTCHAEIDVLRQVYNRNNPTHSPLHCNHLPRKARAELRKVVLYVTRQTNQDTMKPSAPCTECMKLIRSLNIKRIVYSDYNMTIIATTPANFTPTHRTHGFNHLKRRV
jgi:deoxycytidylate deaminase